MRSKTDSKPTKAHRRKAVAPKSRIAPKDARKRADSIVKNMLLHSREGSGEHRPVDVNAMVEEAVNLAYHGARAEKQGFNITLERLLDPAAGEVDCFPPRDHAAAAQFDLEWVLCGGST